MMRGMSDVITPKMLRRRARMIEEAHYASVVAAHPEYAVKKPSWRLRALRSLLWAVTALSVAVTFLGVPIDRAGLVFAGGFYGLFWAYDGRRRP